LLAERVARGWYNPKNRHPGNAISRAMESLDAAGIHALLAVMADGKLEEGHRQKAASAYRDMLNRPEKARDLLIAAAGAEGLDASTRSVIVYALTQSHPKDEAVAACMRGQLKATFKWPPRYKSRLPNPHAIAKAYLEAYAVE
jgi:hypothetical protein